jgi:hypothetical protein
MSDRTDAFGRAYAGSQRQIQTYVNRRRADLDAAILRGLPELAAEGAQIEWVSPLEEERFKEFQDGHPWVPWGCSISPACWRNSGRREVPCGMPWHA